MVRLRFLNLGYFQKISIVIFLFIFISSILIPPNVLAATWTGYVDEEYCKNDYYDTPGNAGVLGCENNQTLFKKTPTVNHRVEYDDDSGNMTFMALSFAIPAILTGATINSVTLRLTHAALNPAQSGGANETICAVDNVSDDMSSSVNLYSCLYSQSILSVLNAGASGATESEAITSQYTDWVTYKGPPDGTKRFTIRFDTDTTGGAGKYSYLLFKSLATAANDDEKPMLTIDYTANTPESVAPTDPTSLPASGNSYNSLGTNENVVWSSTDANLANFRYRTDGVDPTCSTGTVAVESGGSATIVRQVATQTSTTYKVIACDDWGNGSNVVSFTYTYDSTVPTIPTANLPTSSSYNATGTNEDVVFYSTDTHLLDFRYTTNGTDPTCTTGTSLTASGGAATLSRQVASEAATIYEVVACDVAGNKSSMATFTYTYDASLYIAYPDEEYCVMPDNRPHDSGPGLGCENNLTAYKKTPTINHRVEDDEGGSVTISVFAFAIPATLSGATIGSAKIRLTHAANNPVENNGQTESFCTVDSTSNDMGAGVNVQSCLVAETTATVLNSGSNNVAEDETITGQYNGWVTAKGAPDGNKRFTIRMDTGSSNSGPNYSVLQFKSVATAINQGQKPTLIIDYTAAPDVTAPTNPTSNPVDGTKYNSVGSNEDVVWSSTDTNLSTFRYTTDGTDPTCSTGTSVAQSGGTATVSRQVATETSTTYEVIACDASNNGSAVMAFTYTYDATAPTNPTSNPASGTTYTSAGSNEDVVWSSTDTHLKEFRYTTNGTDPTCTTGTAVTQTAGSATVTRQTSSAGATTYEVIACDDAGNGSSVVAFTYTYNASVPGTPTSLPASATVYNSSGSNEDVVWSSTDTTIVDFRYTTNGTDPTCSTGTSLAATSGSATLTRQTSTETSTTYEVIACDGSATSSAMATFTYTYDATVPTNPTSSPVSGTTYNSTGSNEDVVWSSTDTNLKEFRYTTNGTDPTCSTGTAVTESGGSGTFTRQVATETATTYEVIACDDAGNGSSVVAFTYTYDATVPGTPTSLPVSATVYNSSGTNENVVWSSADTSIVDFRYTTNGTDPTCSTGTSLAATSGSGTLTRQTTTETTTTYEVVACDGAGNSSTMATFVYTYDNTAPTNPASNPASGTIYNSTGSNEDVVWSSTDTNLKEFRYTTNGTDPTCSTGTAVTESAGAVTVTRQTATETSTTYEVIACDDAGNGSSVVAFTYTHDSTVPGTPTSLPLSATAYNSSGSNEDVVWSSTDTAIVDFRYTTNGTDPTCSTGTSLAATSGSATLTRQTATETSTTYEVVACDSAVNSSAMATFTYTYDNTVPTSTGVSLDAGAALSGDTTVSVAFTAADTGGSGVKEICINESAVAPATGDACWTTTITTPQDYTFSNSTAGTKTVYVWVKDYASNISLSSNDTILFDSANVTLAISTPSLKRTSGGAATTVINQNGEAVFTVTYSGETAISLVAANVTLLEETAGDSTNCTKTVTDPGVAHQRLITLTGCTDSIGKIGISIAANTATNVNGNAIAESKTTLATVVPIDNVSPTFTGISSISTGSGNQINLGVTNATDNYSTASSLSYIAYYGYKDPAGASGVDHDLNNDGVLSLAEILAGATTSLSYQASGVYSRALVYPLLITGRPDDHLILRAMDEAGNISTNVDIVRLNFYSGFESIARVDDDGDLSTDVGYDTTENALMLTWPSFEMDATDDASGTATDIGAYRLYVRSSSDAAFDLDNDPVCTGTPINNAPCFILIEDIVGETNYDAATFKTSYILTTNYLTHNTAYLFNLIPVIKATNTLDIDNTLISSSISTFDDSPIGHDDEAEGLTKAIESANIDLDNRTVGFDIYIKDRQGNTGVTYQIVANTLQVKYGLNGTWAAVSDSTFAAVVGGFVDLGVDASQTIPGGTPYSVVVNVGTTDVPIFSSEGSPNLQFRFYLTDGVHQSTSYTETPVLFAQAPQDPTSSGENDADEDNDRTTFRRDSPFVLSCGSVHRIKNGPPGGSSPPPIGDIALFLIPLLWFFFRKFGRKIGLQLKYIGRRNWNSNP